MKKVIILLSVILFISGCISMPGTKVSAGKEGIIVNFLENMPPTDSLYEEQSFRVGLEIENYATIPKKIQVCLSDTPGDYFGGIPSGVCEFVEMRQAEKTDDKIIPDIQQVYFPTHGTYAYREVTGDMTTNIIAEINYPYETEASTQICIKTDQNIKTPIKCEMSETVPVTYKYTAPLKISSLKKDIFPISDNEIEILLKLDLQAADSGEIINYKDAYAPITTKKDVLLEFNIDLKGITNKFECSPTEFGKILFNQNRKTLICSATINKREIDQEYLVNPLEIKIKYGYRIVKSLGPIQLISREV
jgi:hypothetical protein